jgi:hypothetical protein
MWIPVPAGDFNNDGQYNTADINLLSGELHIGGSNRVYDLDDDFDVDSDDLAVLIQDIIGTNFGDADLDLEVDLSDLSALAANYGQTSRNWAQGDFDLNGNVNLIDLTLLATYYEGGQAQAFEDFQTLVPEPSSIAIIALAGILLRRRNRR